MTKQEILSMAIDDIYDISVIKLSLHPKINVLDGELHFHTVERWKKKDIDDSVGSKPSTEEMENVKDIVYKVAIKYQEYVDEIIGNFDDVLAKFLEQ